MKGVARAGLGEAEFIAPGERIEAKVMRQFGRALSVALRDVGVEWGGLAVEQAPHLPPPVFDGGRVLVYGRLEKLDAPATVVLKAKGPDGEVRFELPVTPDEASPASSSRRCGPASASATSRRARASSTPRAARARGARRAPTIASAKR